MENVKERPILMNTESVGGILGNRKTQTRRVIKPQPDYSILKKGVVFEAHKCPVLGPVHLGRKEWGLYGKPYQPTAVPCFAYDCPYGKIGDKLWVRETLREASIGSDYSHVAGYAEALPTEPGNKPDLRFYPDASVRKDGKLVDWFNVVKRKRPDVKPRPVISSIFMPRWASRITLEITDIRGERVQDISWNDLVAEGYPMENCINRPSIKYATMSALLEWFIPLWNSINAKPKPIEANGKVISYISYPWEDIRETREHRGLKWVVCGNPHVWAVTFKVLKKEV